MQVGIKETITADLSIKLGRYNPIYVIDIKVQPCESLFLINKIMNKYIKPITTIGIMSCCNILLLLLHKKDILPAIIVGILIAIVIYIALELINELL